VRNHRRAGLPLTMAVLAGIFSAGLVAPAAHAASTGVRINEVESSGGSPGDWIELTNTSGSTVNLTGWVLKDNDDSHVFTIASGTSLAPGGFVALDVDPVFGLGSSDSARLYQPGGTTLVDSYSWTSHASTTYGRCPDGTGAFVTTVASTKGAPNACPPPPAATWPGGTAVANADATNQFGTNLSGLSFQSAGVVWAVDNGPGTLYRLVPNGSLWKPDTTGGFSAGKALHYQNGSGDPDAEGVVYTPDGVLVSTERDNDNNDTSLMKVLRYDPTSTATTLNATAEWNLTSDLPAADPNSGLEGIAWVPDSVLTSAGLHDEHTNAPYDPANYTNHGTGLYFVGSEATGTIYAYALNLAGSSFTRIATIASGLPAVMDLEWEPSTGRLWAECDDTCSGQTTTLVVNSSGRFAVTAAYKRPSGMSNYNNEGFAISPTCAGGVKTVLWSDDSNDKSHALRSGTLSC
jgi:hypothetical protein